LREYLTAYRDQGVNVTGWNLVGHRCNSTLTFAASNL